MTRSIRMNYILKGGTSNINLEKTLDRPDKSCVYLRVGTLNYICTDLLNTNGARTVWEVRVTLRISTSDSEIPRDSAVSESSRSPRTW